METQIYNKMSQTEELSNNPPRSLAIPQQPLPQTVYGTLDHTPMPTSDQFNISDIPLDFEWMTGMHAYVGQFTYSKTDEPKDPLVEFTVNAPEINYNPGNSDNGNPEGAIMNWQALPFFCSKWWTGEVGFKFLAIKPPRVTGKLIVRFTFQPKKSTQAKIPWNEDTLYRGIKREWDLGLTNEFDFDLSGICPLQARPTWIQENFDQMPRDFSGPSCPLMVHPSTYMMGTIGVFPAQYLQPGSIFPDSIRILVFRYFKNTSFKQLTDPSHKHRHSLYTKYIEKPLVWNFVDDQTTYQTNLLPKVMANLRLSKNKNAS